MRRHRLAHLLLPPLAALSVATLSACGGSSTADSASADEQNAPPVADMPSEEPAQESSPEPAPPPEQKPVVVAEPSSTAEPLLSASCAWLFSADPGLVNVFFPDKDAQYWTALLPAIPGAEYIVEGRYPDARYFSYNSYDALFRPQSVITDFQIDPLVPGQNPFVSSNATPGGDYRLTIRLEDKPEQPEPNTLYAGGFPPDPQDGLPSAVVPVLYRTYVAEGDDTGKVGLPQISLAAPGAEEPPIGFSRCQLLNTPVVDQINDLITDLPNPLPVPGINLIPFSEPEPRFRKFYGLPNLLATLIEIGLPVDLPLSENVQSDEGAFLSNINNAYVFSQYSRDKGNSYILRAKAPRHQPSEGGDPAQVRYWSLCTNNFVTTRYVACLRDEEIPLDEDGFFTLVVSDSNNRPDNVTDENHIAWLPWGAIYVDSVLIYRHMLPDPDFAQSVQAIEFGQDERQSMGEFFPETVYCDRDIIEAAGSRASDVFDACVNAADGRAVGGLLDPLLGPLQDAFSFD